MFLGGQPCVIVTLSNEKLMIERSEIEMNNSQTGPGIREGSPDCGAVQRTGKPIQTRLWNWEMLRSFMHDANGLSLNIDIAELLI
jgi:hypothetical protein